MVKVIELETTTSDGIKLRGYRLLFPNQRPNARRKLILYTHGTAVYLPKKLYMLEATCMALEADVIAFAYRSFGLSEMAEPTELGI